MFIRAVQHNSELDAFRAEVRTFCTSEMPAEVCRKQARGQHLERHEYDAWLKRLGSRGWLTGKWPREHGGLGWEPEQFLAFQEELGRAGAPPLISFGPTMAVIMRAAGSNVQEGIIPASGHWTMEENPKATIAMVRGFLDTAK